LLEIEEAAQWYEMEMELPGLGQQFVDAIIISLAKIIQSPSAYAAIFRQSRIRRFLVQPFSYKIFFAIQPYGIHVIAVIHAHRSSRFVRRRLQS
jgi:hypothetical protein